MTHSSIAALQPLHEDAETLALIRKSKHPLESGFEILGFLFTGLSSVAIVISFFGPTFAPLFILGLCLFGIAFWHFSEGYRFKKRVLKRYSRYWVELDAILIKDSSDHSKELFSELKSHLEEKLQNTLDEDTLYVFNKLLSDHQGTVGDLTKTSKVLIV